jgi:GTP-binding protein
LAEDDRDAQRALLEQASGGPVMLMSGVARTGMVDVLRALRARIDADRLRLRADKEEPEAWRP